MASIDERIVRMKFEKNNFEAGATKVQTALAKIKEALAFKGGASGLVDLQGQLNKTNFGVMQGSIDKVSAGFVAMATIGITALSNLVVKAQNAGMEMANALFIQPKTDGFAEYELKLGSIQTIMAGTGDDLGKVNTALDELNTYADQTIYSFSDMTDNIGKFTNAGIGLDDSVGAIKGVANVAALSGANANEASRSMYNFSQALSIGYVGLMDWKSIELANMGTAEFRQQLITSAEAMGTLKKQSDGTWKTLEGTTVTVENFRNTLNDQWLSADVLTQTLNEYADANTDVGKRATEAATQVKTFSHLMDTLKEGQASGWAQTFEIIVGDFDEAKELFTGINNTVGGFFGRMATERNKMLEGWKDNGGRDALLNGLANIFKGIAAAIKPVAEAFRKIFPKTTGKQLADLTKGFEKLTGVFKMGAPIGKILGNVFTGVFTILKVGVDVVKGIASVFGTVFSAIASNLLSGNGGMLEFAGTLTEVIVKFSDFVNKGQFVTKFFAGLNSAISANLGPILQTVKGLGAALVALVQGDKTKAFELMKDALDKLEPVFGNVREGFSNLLSQISSGANAVKTFLNGLGVSAFTPIISALGWLSKAFDDLKSRFDFEFPSFDTSGLKAAEDSTRMLSSAGEKVDDVWAGLKETFKAVGDFLAPIAESLSSVFSKAGDAVGTAIDKIRGYISGLSGDDSVALLNTGLFMGMYIALRGVFKKVGKLIGSFEDTVETIGKSFKSIGSAFDQIGEAIKTFQQNVQATIIVKIALAIGILALALWGMSVLPLDKLAKGLGAIAALMGGAIGAMTAMSKIEFSANSAPIKAGIALGLMAVAVLLLASAAEKLSGLDWEGLAKGLVATGALIGALTLFTKYAEMDAEAMKTAGGLILLGAAILVLAAGVEKFGKMDVKTLIKGLTTLGLVMAALAGMTKVMDGTSGIAKAAVGLILLSVAVLALAGAMLLLEKIDIMSLLKGLGKMAVILVGVGLAMRALPNEGDMIKAASGLLIISGALVVIAAAIKILASLDAADSFQAMVTMAAGLAILVIAVNSLEDNEKGAAVLITISGALVILAAALAIMASLDWEGVAVALVAMAGAFVILGAAGVVLGPLLPVLTGLAGVIQALGIAMLLAGAGFLAFAVGFGMIAAVGVAGVAVLVAAFEGIINLIPLFMQQVGLGLKAFAVVIADAGPEIVAALVTILESLLQAVRDVTPDLLLTFEVMLQGALDTIVRMIPAIVDAGFRLITGFLDVVAQRAPELANSAADAVVSFLDAVASRIPDIAASATNLIMTFMDEVAANVDKIQDHATTLVVDFITELGNRAALITGAAFTMIMTFLDELKSQIDQNIEPITTKALEIGYAIVNGVANAVINIGGRIKDAVMAAVKDAWDSAMSWLGIRSPSRKFYWMGEMSMLGAALGLKENGYMMEEETVAAGKNAVKSLSDVMSKLGLGVDAHMDMAPVIAPVVDMSNVEAASDEMRRILPDALSVVPAYEDALSAMKQLKQTKSNNDGFGPNDTEPPPPAVTNYNQTINSPKAVNAAETYRQTRNLLSSTKGGSR